MHYIKHILFILLILRSEIFGQDKISISRDTLNIPYTHCPDFDALIGSIDKCRLQVDAERVWIKPIHKGFCGSNLQYYYFELRNPEIQVASLYNLPKKIKNEFHYKNAISLPDKNIIIYTDENYRYLVLTDSIGNYIHHKRYPKNNKGSIFTNSGYVFRIVDELYFSYISAFLPPQINNNNTSTFGRIPLTDVLKKENRRLKYKGFVDAFPCNFPNTSIFWFDRQYFPDSREKKLWYMDNYRSKLSSFSPIHNIYDCYELPKQVFKDRSEWHYFDKIDSLYKGITQYREHDKWIINSSQEKVAYTEQEYFTVISDKSPLVFRSTLIITTDSMLLGYLDSISSNQGFNVSNRPMVNGMYIYHHYEWIAVEPESKLIHQVVVPRGQEIRVVFSRPFEMTGFKMILNDKGLYLPALITWKLNF